MALDITLPIAVRAAGPALFVLLGAAIVLLSRGRRDRTALGAFLGGNGLALVCANLGFAGGGAPLFIAGILGYSIAGAGALAWVAWTPQRLRSGGLIAAGALVVTYAFSSMRVMLPLIDTNVLFARIPATDRPAFIAFGYVTAVAQGLALTAPLVWALQARRGDERSLWETAGLAGGLLVSSGFGAGADLLSGSNIAVFIEPRGAALFTLAAAGAWLWVAVERESRVARNVALAALAAMLAGMLRVTITGIDTALDPAGGPGIARLIGWAIVTITVVRAGWLDTAFLSRHRAGLAAAALAALFIVAQLAQQFLSAQYGLLMGGIVAGALLFVANPVQRAMERATDGRGQAQGPGPGPGPGDRARREDVYRKALRIALKDRRLTRDEEMHLHELAQELSIPGARAHQLLVEIEREGGVR